MNNGIYSFCLVRADDQNTKSFPIRSTINHFAIIKEEEEEEEIHLIWIEHKFLQYSSMKWAIMKR